jgi:hypothetical protein
MKSALLLLMTGVMDALSCARGGRSRAKQVIGVHLGAHGPAPGAS